MTRLEKKCFFASAGSHGLLLALLFLGSAFAFSKKSPEVELQLLTFLPAIAVDEAVISGGSPTAKQSPPAAPVETPPPVKPEPPATPPPVVTPPPRHEQPETPAPVPPKSVEKIEPKQTAPPKPEPEVVKSTTPVKSAPARDPKPAPAIRERPQVTPQFGSKPTTQPSRDTRAATQTREREQRMQLANALNRVTDGLSKLPQAASVEMPGPGGDPFAGYIQILSKIYDGAWRRLQELEGNSAVVQIEVVIRRDGQVIAARISDRSGNREVDRTVEDALKSVTLVPKFPENWTDKQRTFRINFDFANKRPL